MRAGVIEEGSTDNTEELGLGLGYDGSGLWDNPHPGEHQ